MVCFVMGMYRCKEKGPQTLVGKWTQCPRGGGGESSSGAGPSPAGRELAGAVGAVDQHSFDVGSVATRADVEWHANADRTVHYQPSGVDHGLTEATAVGHHHHSFDVVVVGGASIDAGEVPRATALGEESHDIADPEGSEVECGSPHSSVSYFCLRLRHWALPM